MLLKIWNGWVCNVPYWFSDLYWSFKNHQSLNCLNLVDLQRPSNLLTGLCWIILVPVELYHDLSQHALTHPTQKCFCNHQRLNHSIVNHMIITGGMYNSSPFSIHIPNDSVCADNKLWPGVPLVIGDVVMCLKPNPLLPFGEKSVVAGLPFTILHYCGDTAKQGQWCSSQK